MDSRAKPKPARSRRAVTVAVALGWIVVMLALAQLLATSQAHGRRDLAQKLSARTQAGAEFSSLYVKDILARERQQAASWLTGRRPTRLSLARSSQALGSARRCWSTAAAGCGRQPRPSRMSWA
jgi:hypothetical protein